MDTTQAEDVMHQLLRLMKERGGSDLFITAGFAPAIKFSGKLTPMSAQTLSADDTAQLVDALMNPHQRSKFATSGECNFAVSPHDIGRFRISAFVQQSKTGMVVRTITTDIPDIDALGAPPELKDVVMAKRGLVIMVGATGSGKSTTLAAMIGHRNAHSYGHIITIEDPIEYVHPHKNCLITQREIGTDTLDWHTALKNTLRQVPDVILIGEIRDRETMDHAIAFAEVGHLFLATLHANNSNQAIDRIINFFRKSDASNY